MKRVVMTTMLTLMVLSTVVVVTTGIRIYNIDDAYIGARVNVSGVVISISNNLETPAVNTFIRGYSDINTIFKIDDGTDTIYICYDKPYKVRIGERIAASGIYAGEGIIYADVIQRQCYKRERYGYGSYQNSSNSLSISVATPLPSPPTPTPLTPTPSSPSHLILSSPPSPIPSPLTITRIFSPLLAFLAMLFFLIFKRWREEDAD
ncbi:MAG: hypothetical protein ACXQTS_01475 [Candidatus Methanospirareceae archaeon]